MTNAFTALTAALVLLIGLGISSAAARLGYPRGGARRLGQHVAGGLVLWLAATGLIAASGFFLDFSGTPPRIALAILPAAAIALYLAWSRGSEDVLMAVPIAWLTAVQAFRIVVEAILWALADQQVIPEIMTFTGRNFDIIIGLTAPAITWFCFVRKTWPLEVANWWNGLGIVLLLNVAITGMLAAPTRFQLFDTVPPNTFVARVPYIWLPAFMVPLALFLHMVSLRCIARQLHERDRASRS